jgi:hypothetical protein
MNETKKVAPPPPDPAFVEALKTRLQTILDRPVTPRSLLELEQTSRLSREMLVVGRAPEALRRPGFGGGYVMPNTVDMIDFGEDSLGDTNGVTMKPNERPETFAATLAREVMALRGAVDGSMAPARIVEAIVVARQQGAHDLAEQLMKQLPGGEAQPLKPVEVLPVQVTGEPDAVAAAFDAFAQNGGAS